MEGNNGPHTVCTFNMGTAEQLGSCLSVFEGPLCQMADYNFNFFIHVLLYLYKEMVEERICTQQEGGGAVRLDNDEY
jgi:hypothetical protein